MPAPIENAAWNWGITVRPSCCSTAVPSAFIETLMKAKVNPLNAIPSATIQTSPRAEPTPSTTNAPVAATEATVSTRRVPCRAITGPAASREASEPSAPNISSCPSWPSVIESSTRIDGSRVSQPENSTPPMPKSASTPQRARRTRCARWGVLALFGIGGVLFSGWLTRLPSIRVELSITEGQLGQLLMFGALGSLASLLAAGPVIARHGTRRVLTVASAAAAGAFVLLGVGSALGLVWMVALGIAFNGLTFAFINVSMNAEGTAVEQQLGRTVMPQFHAAFSIGAGVGALVSSVLAAHDVSPLWQLTGMGVVALAVRLAVIPFVVYKGHAADDAHESVGPIAVIRQAACPLY